ncbi:hypothetical protein HYDPIDRAFT_80918 [Hydnomerulius pinastri MD-312]|nr:hypothetical protein HYDPIDRAFT_80918 [Hydnomerulius pinastri MD-312]
MSSRASTVKTLSEDAASVSGGKVLQEEPQKEDTGKLEKEAPAPPVAPSFPEGGTAAWCTVIGAALVQFCGFGYTSSYGVYQDYYTQHYLTNETSSNISWIGSINAFLVTGLGMVAGMFHDRGYFYRLLIGGALLQSFSLFMLSLAKPGQYYQAGPMLRQRFGSGIAQGLMYVPSIAVVSHYFRQRRTLAMTLVASGSSLGSVIHPIMLNNLFNRGVGFANGVRISAAFVSVLLLIACLLMRTRLDPPKNTANYLAVARGAIRDVPFCLMTVGVVFFQCGFYFPLFFFQLDAVKHGNSQSFSFYSLVLLNGSSFVGRLTSGFIAPYTGVPNLMIISTFLCSVLILGMIGLSSLASVIVIGIIYGYFAGVYIALMAPLMAFLTPELSELGARMGISLMIAGLGSLAGECSPVSGALLTSQYKWWQPALFSGLIALTGCSLISAMQIMLVRRKRAAQKSSA